MEYTEQMYNEDIRISLFVFKKNFSDSPINKLYKTDFIQSSVIQLMKKRPLYNQEQCKYITFAYAVSHRAMLGYWHNKIEKHSKQSIISIDSAVSKSEERETIGDLIPSECDFNSELEFQLLQSKCRQIYSKSKSKTYRNVVECFINGEKQIDIARKLGVSRQRVGQLIDKFREIARKELKENYL